MNTADLPLDEMIFALFKGESKTGKSIAAASFPDPYFMMMEPRIKSVINFWRPRGKEIQYDMYTDFTSILEKLEYWQRASDLSFKTLVASGLTPYSNLLVGTMINMRDSGAKKIKRGGIEMPQIEDYGGEDRGIVILIDKLIAIGLKHKINIILEAHVLTSESTSLKGITTVTRRLVTAGNKIAPKIPTNFDEVWHFDIRPAFEQDQPPSYTIITQTSGSDLAGTALPLPVRIDFTNKSLYDEVMSYVKRAEIINSAVSL